MLFEQRFWPLIEDGTVTLTFRRWRRRQVVPFHSYRTPAGIIDVTHVAIVDPAGIDDADARRSDYSSAEHLRADLRGDPDLPVYRIAFVRADRPDPRAELAADADLDAAARGALETRLARLDAASRHGAWTRETLCLIADRPGVRAADLAAGLGRETQPFKKDVRKLKNLGLTCSLEIGYELSPRGQAYLDGTEA